MLQGIRRLGYQAGYKLHSEGRLVLEIGQGQRTAVINILRSCFPGAKIEITPDLGGIDRVVTITLTKTRVESLSGRPYQ